MKQDDMHLPGRNNPLVLPLFSILSIFRLASTGLQVGAGTAHSDFLTHDKFDNSKINRVTLQRNTQ